MDFLHFLQNGYFSVLIGFILLPYVWQFYRSSKSKYPLPPGPKGSLIIGNLHQVPTERSDIQFEKWAREYNSDIIYLNLLGQPVVVLNTVEVAVDLLDKKGAIYSDRPSFGFLEALGFKHNVALTRDGAKFRKLRKPYGNFLSARSSLEYRDSQLKYARLMADEIKKCPEKWVNYLSMFATIVLFGLAFAIDVVDKEDRYAKLAENMAWIISNMGNNGFTILDILPWVENVPRWIGKFIPSVRYVYDHVHIMEEFHQRPFDELKSNFKAGTSRPSFLGRLLEARESRDADQEEVIKSFTDEEIKGTGGSLYSAGQDTTFATVRMFVMGMILSPDVQIRAQKEIDAVTGSVRLPDFGDRKALPCIERIVYEALRFHPTVPNGIPHRTLKEDIYHGMYIPKGSDTKPRREVICLRCYRSMVIFNAWSMLHNPAVYKNPFTFNPDRYIPASEGGAGEPTPVGQFGFGRRICPGQYVGMASAWIAIATLLAKFDISPPKDKDGRHIMPRLEFTTGITSHPVPFGCVFTPRNL